MPQNHRRLAGLVCLAALSGAAAGAEPAVYLARDAFLREAFPEGGATPATLWLTETLRVPLEQALGQSLPLLRTAYWRAGNRTAWILDEVGKEEPITIGIVIDEGGVEAVRILEYRETRGAEVRFPFFTDQFAGARLANGGIDREIDGITGATLSVRAVTRAVRIALLLHASAIDGGLGR